MGTALDAKEQIMKVENDRLRDIVREQGEFIQKLKRDIRDFLNHPSLG